MGSLVEIEVAEYKIPFAGDSSLFEYRPRSHSGWSTKADISRNHISLQLTNWSLITGRDEEINRLKEVARTTIIGIENQLDSLREESKAFTNQLQEKIKAYFDKRAREVKIKLESNDKLKPF